MSAVKSTSHQLASHVHRLHPLPVRIMHWVNAVAIFIMIGSGWKIYNDDVILGWLHFPDAVVIGKWAQYGLQWHFLGMWIFVINGFCYLSYWIWTGRFRQKLFPVSLREILATANDALHFRLAHDDLTHYQIELTNGKIADGHMVENNPKENFVIISGRTVSDRMDLYDLRAQKDIPEDKITIPRSEITSMQNYGPWLNNYLALDFTMTGLHALHVLAGAIVIGFLWGPGSKLWKTDPDRFTNRVEVSGLFWHFVDLVWIFLFPVLYLT